jgi:hypothetical protein
VSTSALATLDGAAYADVDEHAYPLTSSHVLRVDLQSGRLQATSPPLSPYASIVAAGGSIWVTGTSHGELDILRLDRTNLSVTKRLSIADRADASGSASYVAAHGDVVWVASGDVIAQVGTNGDLLGRVTLAGTVGGLALSPNGAWLYDVFDTSTSALVQERNAATWGVLASSPLTDQVAVRALSADSTGVWLSVVGGMTAGLERLAFAHLSVEVSSRDGSLSGTNALRIVDSGGVLWWIDSEDVECLAPTSGVARSRTTVDTDGALVALGSSLLVSTPAGLSLLTPPGLCEQS